MRLHVLTLTLLVTLRVIGPASAGWFSFKKEKKKDPPHKGHALAEWAIALPVWVPDQEWDVLQHRIVGEVRRLHFKVRSVKDLPGCRQTILLVTAPAEPSALKAAMVFLAQVDGAGAPRSLAVGRIESAVRTTLGIARSDLRLTRGALDARPLLLLEPALPLDFPLLRADLRAPRGREVVTEHPVHPTPTDPRSRVLVQRVRAAGTMATLPETLRSVRDENLVEVLIYFRGEHLAVRQIWGTGHPWPLFTQDPDCWTELVPAPPPKKPWYRKVVDTLPAGLRPGEKKAPLRKP